MPSCAERMRAATTFAFSTAGLVALTALYSTAGGFLFRWLEQDRELSEMAEVRRLVEEQRHYHVQLLWNITETLNVLYRSNWTAEAEQVLGDFQRRVYALAVERKWDGKDTSDELSPKWNLPGALLYAVTAVTTIGYGHVTPLTTAGRVATMLYALLGIPLTIMCMANVGKVFAKLFRLVYHALCCGLCCFCCTYRRARARVFRPVSRRDDHETLCNGGGGGKANGSIANGGGHANGIGLANGGGRCQPQPSVVVIVAGAPTDAASAVAGDVDASEAHSARELCSEKVEEALADAATVPVYLCLIVMSSYICGGAVIFGVWEDWGFVAGAYFCFVTLTTIGFGDYVPGMTISSGGEGGVGTDWVATQKLVLCVIYVFFGLALIAMCFDLMRETVTAKAIWLATRLGFYKDADDESDDDADDT